MKYYFFANQIYGVLRKSQMVGLGKAEVADFFGRIQWGNFYTTLISKQETMDIKIKLKNTLQKNRQSTMLRIEGDITIVESFEFADAVLNMEADKETVDLISLTYDEDQYRETERISIWY